MAVDMFLTIKGIEGESKDSKHKGEIDVLSWNWGVTQSGSGHIGRGSGVGKAEFQDMTIHKWLDQASNKLLRLCATGEHIKEAVLTVRKAGKEQLEYLKITMQECLITSVQTGEFVADNDDRLKETVGINFAKVSFEYWPQTGEGSLGGVQPFKYDIKGNTFLG
jgi:type VI secretion system secreted protein Hcp